MIEFIKSISIEARAALYLSIAEKTFNLVDISDERYKYGREALDKCWDWVEKGSVKADSLYELIDNAECTGISEFGMEEEEYQREAMWYTLVDAVAYTSWQAFNRENYRYLPQAIEGIDEEEINDFINNAADTQVFSIEDIDDLKRFLLEEYSLNSPLNGRIKKEEILEKVKN
ncbi:MAG: hypothetical protein K0R84_1771 [Clostridia bacterium]|jgi:hypothetical protein|nr:hypothetical protein [Clostridia bacterium]